MNDIQGIALIRRLVIIGAIAYALIISLGYLYTDKFLLQPPKVSYQDSPEILKLQARDGAQISAVFLHNTAARYTLLYSHNSSTDLGQMLPVLKALQQHGFAVFAYDYQGYGTSGGAPSETNTYYDAEVAYKYLTQTLGIAPQNIISYGKGMGAAVALNLAATHPVAGLVLESPFASALSRLTGVSWIPFDTFDNLDKIRQVKCPILIIHGKKDRIVPLWNAKKLYEQANQPKFAVWIENAGHEQLLTVAPGKFWQALDDFTAHLTRTQQEQQKNT